MSSAATPPAKPADDRNIHRRLLPVYLAGPFAVVAWILLFTGGVVVGTDPYRDALNPANHSQKVTNKQIKQYLQLSHDRNVRDDQLQRILKPFHVDTFYDLGYDDANLVLSLLLAEPARAMPPRTYADATEKAAKTPADETTPETTKAETLPGEAPTTAEPAKDASSQVARSHVANYPYEEVPLVPVNVRSLSGAPQSVLEAARYWFYVITCYSISNIALLSCLAALLGAVFFQLSSVIAAQVPPPNETGDAKNDSVTSPASTATPERPAPNVVEPKIEHLVGSFIQGFVIYLIFVSGLLFVVQDPFTKLSPETYIRMAGVISLVSFWAGFSPGFLANLVPQIIPRPGSKR